MGKLNIFKKLQSILFEEKKENGKEEYRIRYKRELIHRSQKIYFLQPLTSEAGKIYPYQKYSIIEIYDNDFVVILNENEKDAKAHVIPQCFIERYAIDANTYCNLKVMKIGEYGEQDWWYFWHSIKRYRSSDYECTSLMKEYENSFNILSSLIISLFQHCDNDVASEHINDILDVINKLIEVYSCNRGNDKFPDVYGAEISTYNYIKRIINNYVQQNGYKDLGCTSAKDVAFKIVNGMEY